MEEQFALSPKWWSTPYLFNGKELDSRTSLYYYGARYFDPGLSVWLSVDPLAEKYAGWSSYAFTMNNPITLIDPDGRGVKSVDDWFEDAKGNKIWVDSKASTYIDENGTKYRNIGPDHVIDGPKNVIFHKQNEVVATFDKSDNIKHSSFGLDIAVIIGGGIEAGMYSDGKTEVPYFTAKYGFGLDIGASIESGNATSREGNLISFLDLQGQGGENSLSIGPVGFTYATERDGIEFGANEHSKKYSDKSFSLQLGPIPFGLTGFTTKTWIGTPIKIDRSRMNPIGER